MNARKSASEYIARGWAVVPLPARQKAPNIPAWQKRGFAPDDFANGDNIGVVLGEPSGGLVDVDLDDPLAVELAREFLPATGLTFGHGEYPQAHLLYVCDSPGRTRQWKASDGAVVLELRSTGGQTMFPPSVHPCGEPVKYCTQGEPAPASWQELETACADLAAAVRASRGEPAQETPPPAPTVVAPDDRQRLMRRGERYADAAKPSAEGGRNSQAFSLAGHLAAFREDAARLTEGEIVDLLRTRWNPRNTPPLPENELAQVVHSAMVNGTPRVEHPARSAQEAQEEKPAQAEAIVRLALENYRVGATDAGEPFAVERSGPNIARVFRGGRDALRAALARDYRRAFGRTANASALADALTTLEGESLDATAEPVGLRVAEHNGGIILDLGDAKGQVVIVRPGGWEIVSASPLLFRRTALTGALPVPAGGGTLDELLRLLNVNDETWPLVRGWLVAALLPSIPHPILLLGGEQGTGKSTAARMLVNLIDPSPAPLRSEPRDPEAWALAAAGSWAVAVDNVSKIQGWWSDVLCRAVSGDGWVRRRLYTDSDLSVLAFRRVVILTSIDAGAMRGDLGDRLLLADLERIGEAGRKTDAELEAAYRAARPRILGGLLDALAGVLIRLPSIKVPAGLPRMADFARVLAALDDADGPAGRALSLYRAQAGRVAGEVLEADPVGMAILALLDSRGGTWEGTTADLLQAIRPGDKAPHGWPETPLALAGRLKRLTPAFRAGKVEVERDRTGHQRARRLTIRRTA